MPYRKPIFFHGGIYHVFNRGLNRQEIFLDHGDKQRFVHSLSKCVDNSSFLIHAYCLMPNHYHLLIEQAGEPSVTEFMTRLGIRYVRGFNQKHRRKGPLFEGRFKAKLVDSDEYFLQVSKYIHLNPFLGGLIRFGEVYRWSSLRSYLGELVDPFVTTSRVLEYFSLEKSEAMSYLHFVREGFSELEWKAYQDNFEFQGNPGMKNPGIDLKVGGGDWVWD